MRSSQSLKTPTGEMTTKYQYSSKQSCQSTSSRQFALALSIVSFLHLLLITSYLLFKRSPSQGQGTGSGFPSGRSL